MNVREIMTKDPACCTPETELMAVARTMVDNDCGAIPVVEDLESRTPVGIVTDRDVTVRAVANGKNPIEMTVGEIMTSDPVTVEPEMTIEDARHSMEQNQVRRLLVIDETGACCGMVSQADLVRAAAPEEAAGLVEMISQPT